MLRAESWAKPDGEIVVFSQDADPSLSEGSAVPVLPDVFGQRVAGSTLLRLPRSERWHFELFIEPIKLGSLPRRVPRRGLLPHNVGDLVRVVVDYLSGSLDESRSISRYCILNPRMTKSVVGRVAYEAQRQGIVEFHADVAREVVPAELGDRAPSDIFEEIAFATGLWRRVNAGGTLRIGTFRIFFARPS